MLGTHGLRKSGMRRRIKAPFIKSTVKSTARARYLSLRPTHRRQVNLERGHCQEDRACSCSHKGSPTNARLLARATIFRIAGMTSTLVHSATQSHQ